MWLRYLDDFFCVWDAGKEKLNEFLEFMNSFHNTIKFTMDCSNERINFLDVSLYKKNGKLQRN